MPVLGIRLDGDGAWPDLADKEVVHLAEDANFEMAGLASGMQSGAPSVAFRLDLPDGRVVVAETSWRLFTSAFHAFAARFGADPDLDGTAVVGDFAGAGPMKLDLVKSEFPFALCELCGKRRDATENTPEAAREVVQWLHRHFREEHPDWTPP